MRPVNVWRVCRGGMLAIVLTGCSLSLDWDPQGLPCEENTCADGYTCLINQCILDGSVVAGQTCNEDELCQDDLICGNFKCSTPCSSFYESSAECAVGEYCAEHLFNGAYRGHCEEGDSCEAGDSCDEENSRKKCVTVTSGVNECMLSCEITWVSGTTYTDSCGGTGSQLQYCQPLGKDDELVCRNTKTTAQELGQPCDVVENTCRRELACINGVCREYCNPLMSETGSGTSEQCDGDFCCEKAAFAVCDPTCDF